MDKPDPRAVAERVVAKALGGIEIDLADSSMTDVGRACMIAALEWAYKHPFLMLKEIARLKGDDA